MTAPKRTAEHVRRVARAVGLSDIVIHSTAAIAGTRTPREYLVAITHEHATAVVRVANFPMSARRGREDWDEDALLADVSGLDKLGAGVAVLNALTRWLDIDPATEQRARQRYDPDASHDAITDARSTSTWLNAVAAAVIANPTEADSTITTASGGPLYLGVDQHGHTTSARRQRVADRVASMQGVTTAAATPYSREFAREIATHCTSMLQHDLRTLLRQHSDDPHDGAPALVYDMLRPYPLHIRVRQSHMVSAVMHDPDRAIMFDGRFGYEILHPSRVADIANIAILFRNSGRVAIAAVAAATQRTRRSPRLLWSLVSHLQSMLHDARETEARYIPDAILEPYRTPAEIFAELSKASHEGRIVLPVPRPAAVRE